MTIEECREQIQQDLCCLLEGFCVRNYKNCNGQSLEELACQIIVDNFNRLCKSETLLEKKWSWYETLGVPWLYLTYEEKEEIKKQFPDMVWKDVCWVSVLVEKELQS